MCIGGSSNPKPEPIKTTPPPPINNQQSTPAPAKDTTNVVEAKKKGKKALTIPLQGTDDGTGLQY